MAPSRLRLKFRKASLRVTPERAEKLSHKLRIYQASAPRTKMASRNPPINKEPINSELDCQIPRPQNTNRIGA